MSNRDYWSSYWQRRRFNRRRFLGTAGATGAGLAAVGLVGCGDDDDDDDDTGGSPTPGGSGSPGASETATGGGGEETRGGVYQRVVNQDMAIDNLSQFTSNASAFAQLVYSKLIRHVASPDPMVTNNFEIEGDLASDWEQVDDLTYTFTISPDAVFQNLPPVNGRAVTADDVVQSFLTFINEPTNGYAPQFSSVDGDPVAIDESTVQFKTKEPFAPFLSAVLSTAQFFYIFPTDIVDNAEARINTPVGSGPYMYKGSQTASFWEFEANPNFFLKGADGQQLPFLDGVKYNVVPEAVQAQTQFLAGNLDKGSFTPDSVEQVRDQISDATIIELPGAAKPNIVPQLRSGPFTDQRLRNALSMAVDRDAILALVGAGQGSWNNIVGGGQGQWFVDPRESGPGAEFMKYDPEAARTLIEQAGFTDTIRYAYPNDGYGDAFNQTQTVIIDFLKQAGFKVETVTLSYRADYIGPGATGAFFGDYEGLLAGYQPRYPHAFLNFNNVLKTGGVHNSGGITDPELDEMIAELGREFDQEAAYALSHEIQNYAIGKMYMVPTASAPTYSAYQPNVNGYSVSAPYQDAEVQTVWKSA